MAPVVFAIGPQGLGSRGAVLRARLGEVLSERLETEVVLFACASYDELLTGIERQNVAIAWMPPAVYVQARVKAPVHLLARSIRHGSRVFRGALFVKAGSRFESLGDLSGRRIGWVDPHSCAGHLCPRKAVLDAGVDPDRHFGEQLFIGSHVGVARAVHGGEVDVGATFVHLDEAAEVLTAGWRKVDGDDAFRTLLLSEGVPADALGATGLLPEALRARTREVLFELGADPETRGLLEELFECVAFEEAQEADYEVVRDLREAIRLL